ncbi:MAG: hypothetical protein C0501_15030 [Isosphaera sp.]|nr:hypothetical protein [Isosphaera sp.]
MGTVEGLRLRAYVRFQGLVDARTDGGKEAAYPECVVDTGSYLTIVPEKIWSYFLPGVVTPLPFHPSMPAHLRRLTIAGGTFDYDLGELVIPLRDRRGGALDVTVVAKFTRDGGRLNVPLTLGFRGGFLDGRVLRTEPDPAAPHGQRWTLEDP